MSDRPRLIRRLAGLAAWPVQAGYMAIGPAFDFRAPGSGMTVAERWIDSGGYRLRLVTMTPDQARPGAPRLLFCHGGGWFIGGPRAHAGMMRRLVAATGWAMTSIDYRLAPRWPIRAAYADCAAALAALRRETAGPLFLAGESAGAAMAYAAACGQSEIAGLILICPVADLDRRDGGLARASRTIDWGVRLFSPGWFDSRSEAAALSPLRLPLPERFAPTLILAGGADPLRIDARALHERLEAHGHEATVIAYPRMPHGFFSMGRLTRAAETAIADVAGWMQARAT